MDHPRRVLCLIALFALTACTEDASQLPAPLHLAPTDSIFELPPSTTARLETLVPPEKMSASENGVFNDDGRFFVVGTEGVYEIVGGPESFSATVFAANPGCVFGGITAKNGRLYAPCTRFDSITVDLIVYDPAREEPMVGRAPIVTRGIAHFNGSAFGPDGALYLSNTLAVDSPDPAVVRLEILGEEPLVFEQTPIVAATQTGVAPDMGGGTFPNGIRFYGDTMYYVRGIDLVRTRITGEGTASALEVIYEADGRFPAIDDFDIGDERMWLTEFDSFDIFGLPTGSELVVTDLDGNREFAFDLPFIPSSTIVAIDTKFGPASILITSYFNGGLYRLTFEK